MNTSNTTDVIIEDIKNYFHNFIVTFRVGNLKYQIEIDHAEFEKLDEKSVKKAIEKKLIELYKESEVEKFRKSLLKKIYKFDLKSLVVVERL